MAGRLGGLLAGVALVDVGQLDRIPGRFRHGLGQDADLITSTSRSEYSLAGVLGKQAEIRQDELPLGVGGAAGVRLVGDLTLISRQIYVI